MIEYNFFGLPGFLLRILTSSPCPPTKHHLPHPPNPLLLKEKGVTKR
jgi:hypothetical protein